MYFCLYNHLECKEEIVSKFKMYYNLIQFYKHNKLDLNNSLLPITFFIDHNDSNQNQWKNFTK